LKNNRLRWSFLKWRIDVKDDVASFWETNNSNFSSQIDFVSCSLSLIQKRSARRVCMCVCVCLCVREKMRIKSVVFEKSLYSVEFRDFCLLKSILELIICSLVNIKRKRRSLLRWQNSEVRVYIYASNYRSSFFSLYSFRSQIILSYFNLLCCLNFLNSLNLILVSNFVVLSRHQHDRFKWTAKTRSRCVLFRSKSDLDHKENERNDVRTKVFDAARMNRLLYA
jgi:hypothetical protein